MKLTAPISLSQVASIIGCGSADVGKVCTHININNHSLRKPTYIAKSDTASLSLDLQNYKPSGRAGTKSVGYGLIVPTTSNKTYQQLFNYFGWSAKVWTHNKPTTQDDNWKNLAHFYGYSTTATEAESIIKATQIRSGAKLMFDMTTKWGGDESVSPQNVDFGFEVYPCVMVCVDNVPTWLFGSTKPIKTCDSVLSFATNDNEKVNENKIYTFVPFLSSQSPQAMLNKTGVTTATTYGVISPSTTTTTTAFAYGSYNLVAKVNALKGIANSVKASITVSKVFMANDANRVDQNKACVTVYMENKTAEKVNNLSGNINWSASNNKSGSISFRKDMLAKDDTFLKDFEVDITGTENAQITFTFDVQYTPDGMSERRTVDCNNATFVNDTSIPAFDE